MIHAHRLPAYILCAYVLTLAAGSGFSGSAFSQVETASGADAAPKSSQPVDFRTTRVEIRDEYQDLQGGGTVYMIVPRVDFSANPDLSFRFETPIVFADPGMPNNGSESGIGDLLFRGSYRVARGAGYAIVAGGEIILNTATKDALGTGKNVIAPLIFASIDLPQYNSVVFPFLQHYVTLGGGDARRDVHYTSIKSAFLTRWPNLIYTIVEPQVIVDHERADKVGLTLEGEVGRFLNRDTAIWARPGIGLSGDNLPPVYDWKFEVGVRFFLK
ncbi:MAG: hypothetical protein HY067_02640 [Betaproteobacteria bacterium]|nr:hypothetical protein [Betaproteobacteria bacterium]